MQKRKPLLSSFFIMLCLGSIYAWSIFVPELKETYELSTAQTQLIFGTVIGVFTLTMIWAARLNKVYRPHIIATLSGSLYFLGYLLAYFSGGNFILLMLGIGVLGGMGTGMGYLISLSVPVKWYPDNKGFVTGVVVAGFGAGAIILTYLTEYLLQQGTDVLIIFLLQGIAYGLLIVLAAQWLKAPNEDTSAVETKPITANQRGYVYLLCFGIFTGTFTGLLVIGNLKPIAQLQAVNEMLIPLSISLFALANFAGRITWGWLSDKYSNTYLVPLALMLQALASFKLFFTASFDSLFVALVLVIGFTFGANFVLFAKETINKFGISLYEKLYPFIFLGYGFAGIVGPFTGGKAFDLTGSYFYAIAFAVALSLIASVAFVVKQKAENL